MLRAFGHPVAKYCDMLGVVGLGLKIFKFELVTPNDKLAVRAQNVAPNSVPIRCVEMLRSFSRGFRQSKGYTEKLTK